MNSDHLTSEQMDALLANSETPEGSQHLQICDACSDELESLQAVMTDLRAAVIGSAGEHRRLAVMPAPAQRTPRAMWSLVAATALLCVAGPILMHTRPAHVAVVQAPQAQVQGAVSDEQLMSDIQQDLSSSVPQAMLPLTAKDASVSATDATSNVKENE